MKIANNPYLQIIKTKETYGEIKKQTKKGIDVPIYSPITLVKHQ
jgi:hypothetical protein